jgi:hypothetical protein
MNTTRTEVMISVVDVIGRIAKVCERIGWPRRVIRSANRYRLEHDQQPKYLCILENEYKNDQESIEAIIEKHFRQWLEQHYGDTKIVHFSKTVNAYTVVCGIHYDIIVRADTYIVGLLLCVEKALEEVEKKIYPAVRAAKPPRRRGPDLV